MNKKHHGKFIILPVSAAEAPRMYELKETIAAVPQMVGKEHAPCPCCKEPMVPIMDIQQSGFWADKYHTFLVCQACSVAVVYVYELSRIEPTGKKIKKGYKNENTTHKA